MMRYWQFLPQAAFSSEDPAGSPHWRACLFVDESPAGLDSNSVGDVFINFTFLETCCYKAEMNTPL